MYTTNSKPKSDSNKALKIGASVLGSAALAYGAYALGNQTITRAASLQHSADTMRGLAKHNNTLKNTAMVATAATGALLINSLMGRPK